MKPEQLYQHLKELTEKLDITLSEQNLRATAVKAKSGLCKIEDKTFFIMDKHQSIHKKIEILATCLGKIPHEDIYIIPAIREYLKKFT
ncbi:MAG: hypothetical protein JSW04_00805 [Desulfobacterales bacterium]|nr:MAG: hypothetical protein JSV38_09955 [Desulfobacterales bacterium]UCD90016.1 MAG: hypothetical protein JSW04_00805 [Desulfobacterales bacterium]